MPTKNPLDLTQAESAVLQDVMKNGTQKISNEQIGLLIQGMIKSSESAFNSVVDVVQKDTKLCSTISSQMNEVAEKIISSNHELTKIQIEAYKMCMDSITQFIRHPTDPDIKIKDCFIELRHYASKMESAVQRNVQENKEAHRRAQEMNQKVLERNKTDRNAIIFSSIAKVSVPLLAATLTTYFNNKQ